MALSQLQCLDNNHVNLRTTESKPEFLYCEDQRLALEALLRDGREAFFKYVEARGLRGFLSDPELETLGGAVEPYDPGSELFPENAEDGDPPMSLHYWPEVSDMSVPQMDLGWPDSEAYRGVTRTTMYSQPPLDGQLHIKEVVRKMIAQAQKVIAVVMDVFTDVDIFRDLLDAGFKRRVSVYILLEHTTLPHFLSMCQRANMHAGHLKHLRVRCSEGTEFYTRYSTKVRGRMGHRFMFIDGDKAVSGSYSFTWMSSRLDRNLITVVTGQAVEAFDRLFCILYVTSSSVELRQVAMEPEPEPDSLPQPVSVVPPSAAVARKLYSPKYALALGNSSPTPSAGHNSSKKTQSQENSSNPEVLDPKKRRRGRASKESIQEPPPIHPGLTNLEKACLISYLPTWPEPDPPSDVIGFINIRDTSKPHQVHLQRSEMFETSQAIRFSSPFSIPKETLPEVAKPRQLTAKQEEMNKPAQDKTKAEESVVDRAQPTQLNAWPGDIKSKAKAPENNSPASGLKCKSVKNTPKTLNTEDKLHSNTPTSQDAGQNTTPHLSEHTPPQSNRKAPTSKIGGPSHTTQAVPTNNPRPDSLPESNIIKEETSSNTQNVSRPYTLELNSTKTSPPTSGPTDSNTRHHTQRLLPHTDSNTQEVYRKPQNFSEITPNIQTPTIKSYVSPSATTAMCSQPVSSTFLSENVSATATGTISAPLASISPPLSSSTSNLSPPLPSSSASSSLTSTPPIPKPRTIQLVIKDCVTSDGQKLQEFSVVKRHKTSTGPQVVRNETAVATDVQKKSSEKESEMFPELQNNSGSKTGAQKDTENTGKFGEAPQQKRSGTSQETNNEKAVGLHDDRAGLKLVAGTNLNSQSGVLITDTTKAESVNFPENNPKDVEPKTLTSIDKLKLTPRIDCVATVQAGTKATKRVLTGCEFAEVPNEKSKNVTQHKTYRLSTHDLQRISYSALTSRDTGVLDTMDSLKASTHTPVYATQSPHMSKDIAGDCTHANATATHGQRGNSSFTAARCTDSVPDTAKHNTHSTFQELIPKARASTHTPEKSLCLHLSDTDMKDLLSPMPEREAQSLTPLIRTPTPDGFLPHTPTPDSRMHTPDPRSYTPDFQTPTADISEGYVSPRTDSTLSTTSEEYYECSDSPFHEPVFDQARYCNHGTKEDHVSFTYTSTPNATTVATSPACINDITTTDRNTSSSETQRLSGPASVSSSSLLEEKVKKGEEEEEINKKNGREVDEMALKLSVAERRTEGDSRETQRRGSEEAKSTADNFKQGKYLNDTDKITEAQSQAPKRKRLLNQSTAERLVDGGLTPGELTNERAEPKRLSTGDLKPKKAPSEGERPDKEKAVDRAAVGPSSRGKPQSTREGQKLLHTPPRPPRGQQQNNGVCSPSSQSRSSRPLSGARPCGSRQPSQAESKALHGSFQVLDNTSSPHRPPSRPPPPVSRPPPPVAEGAGPAAGGSAAGLKQAEVSHSQQSLLSRQPLASQGTAKAGQYLNQHPYPKPPASFLHTYSNVLPQHHRQSQNQTVSAEEAHCQEEGKTPSSLTFSRMYSFKTLKDKMNKLPAQSKKGSTSSAVQAHKSTS